jgi:hypothetical protein
MTSKFRMPRSNENRTSARLRAAAVQAITEAQRPMTAHDIQEWITKHDENLESEIASKCYDYVRIILSLSPTTEIRRYRPVCDTDAIDARTGFYGLSDGDYSASEWAPLTTGAKNNSDLHPRNYSGLPRNRPQIPPHRPAASLFCANLHFPAHLPHVDQSAYANAWFALNTFIDQSDPFWNTLNEGIKTMKSEIERGRQPEDVLKMVITTKPLMQNPIVLDDIVTILSREAGQKQEELWFTDILDNVV